MKNNNVLRIFFLLLILINYFVIFNFSSEDGQKSDETSMVYVDKILSLNDKINSMEEPKKQEIISSTDHVVRKIAHFTIYTYTGVIVIMFMRTYDKSRFYQSVVALSIGAFYASLDEVHQTFVIGRSGQITDVLLDSCGVLFGILLIQLIGMLIEKNRKKSKIKKEKKVMFISSTGGHLNELLQLKSIFYKYNYSIVTEKTESNKDLKDKYKGRVTYLWYGTKKNLIKYAFVFTFNFCKSLVIFIQKRPDVVITTGTHTAVPMCYIAKFFCKKVIFIETFANINTRTVAGRFVYPIADVFVVQWEDMLKLYPNAQYWGWIY